MRELAVLSLAAFLPALELPGVPVPGPLGDGRGQILWGNDAFGPAGGSRSDDFRTNQMGVSLGWGHLIVGLDHSILTTSNPTEAPMYWGMEDPAYLTRVGAERVDEVTLTLGWREERRSDTWAGWGQAGGGALVTGDLAGREIQNGVHTIIAQQHFKMPYERSSLRCLPLAYAGLGGAWVPWSGWGFRGGALGEVTAEGWRRWQIEGLSGLEADGGGVWGGWRMQGSAGDAATRTAQIVAEEESGPSLVAGFRLVAAPGWGAGLETGRNLQTEAQYGRLVVTWAEPLAAVGHRSGRVWWGRIGLLPAESRVKGRGLDHAVATTCGPLLVLLGYRDNELSNHWVQDMSGRRNMVWAGVGQAPDLCQTGPLTWTGWWEAGAGYRHTVVRSQGFLTLDGEHAYSGDAAIVRGAIGGGPRLSVGPGAEVGLLALGEGLWSSKTETLEVQIRNVVFPDIVVDRHPYPVEGSAFGGILALTGRWVF